MRENLIYVLYENFNFQLRKEEQTTADTKDTIHTPLKYMFI